MSGSVCANPLGCAAIHELRTHVGEMNTKLTSVFAMLQLFFDQARIVYFAALASKPFVASDTSWKQAESGKTQGSNSPVCLVTEDHVTPVEVHVNPITGRPMNVESQATPIEMRANRKASRPMNVESQATPVEMRVDPNTGRQMEERVEQPIIDVEAESIMIKEEVQDREFDNARPAIDTYEDELQWQPEYYQNSSVVTTEPSTSTPSLSNGPSRKRQRIVSADYWDPGEASTSGLAPDISLPWAQHSLADDSSHQFDVSMGNDLLSEGTILRAGDYSIPASVIQKAAEAANKASTLEQRIKKFAWQLVVRTIPVGHMWDLMGAVTCSSKDASNAADLLAKQKEPVRTILRITLEQYKIGEEHVGKVWADNLLRLSIKHLAACLRVAKFRSKQKEKRASLDNAPTMVQQRSPLERNLQAPPPSAHDEPITQQNRQVDDILDETERKGFE